jgi:hypothetical protein
MVACVLMPRAAHQPATLRTLSILIGLRSFFRTSVSALSTPNFMPMQPARAMASTAFSVTAMASPITDQAMSSLRSMISWQSPRTCDSFTVKMSSSK